MIVKKRILFTFFKWNKEKSYNVQKLSAFLIMLFLKLN